MNKSLIPHFLLTLITLAVVVPLAGCASTDLYKDSIFDRHPRVKWLYESRREFYRLPSPLVKGWMRQEFTDAALFRDRLLLCCQNQGGTVQPEQQHIYIINTNNGKELRNIAFTRVCDFHWYVKSSRLVVVSEPWRELATENTYDLKTGLSVERDVETSSLEHTKLDDVTDTIKYIVFQRISDPPGPDRPYESIKDVWVGQMEPGLRLVQEVHPGPRRYNLYLETVSKNSQTNRVKLIRLRRFYPSFHCWVGYDSAGDYIIVLRYIVLGVRKTDNSNIN